MDTGQPLFHNAQVNCSPSCTFFDSMILLMMCRVYLYYSITVCGKGNEVCGAGETCKNNACLARKCNYTQF